MLLRFHINAAPTQRGDGLASSLVLPSVQVLLINFLTKLYLQPIFNSLEKIINFRPIVIIIHRHVDSAVAESVNLCFAYLFRHENGASVTVSARDFKVEHGGGSNFILLHASVE